ncbi:MAG: hypothetical protein ACLQPD_17255 [Desulfomonilaceae bacterium]
MSLSRMGGGVRKAATRGTGEGGVPRHHPGTLQRKNERPDALRRQALFGVKLASPNPYQQMNFLK